MRYGGRYILPRRVTENDVLTDNQFTMVAVEPTASKTQRAFAASDNLVAVCLKYKLNWNENLMTEMLFLFFFCFRIFIIFSLISAEPGSNAEYRACLLAPLQVFSVQDGTMIKYVKNLHVRPISALLFFNPLKYLITGCKDGCSTHLVLFKTHTHTHNVSFTLSNVIVIEHQGNLNELLRTVLMCVCAMYS